MNLDESYCEIRFGPTPARQPFQQLAYAVIEQALTDLFETDSKMTLTEAESAREFFTSGDYKSFLYLADLDSHWVLAITEFADGL